MKSSYLLLAALIGFTFAAKPIELTDATFEHDTQATTGSTTGDWLVSFCNRQREPLLCSQSDAIWQKVSDKLRGRVSVAHVDL